MRSTVPIQTIKDLRLATVPSRSKDTKAVAERQDGNHADGCIEATASMLSFCVAPVVTVELLPVDSMRGQLGS